MGTTGTIHGGALTGFAAGPVSSNLVTAATGGLLTRGVGLELHLLLIDPLAFFFMLHIASGIGLALIRLGQVDANIHDSNTGAHTGAPTARLF